MTMRSRFVSMIAATLLFAVTVARAQLGGGGTPAAETLVQVAVAPVTVAAGGTATASVKLTVLAGWHVNANPPALEYNIPTTVTLSGGSGLETGRVHYPPGKQEKFGFEDSPLLVYDGTVVVSVPIAAAAGAKSATLEGKVEYQACNNEVCLAPTTVPFEVQVNVTAAGAATAVDTAAAPRDGFSTFTSAPPPGTTAASPGSVRGRLEGALAGGGLVWFFALFAGGLLLNLTPCVFPMIGITVSIFGARRNEPLPKVVTTAVVYVLGICVTYTVAGAGAAITGSLFGSALQNTWVVAGLGGFMLLLSLGMFGVYEMQPPPWLMDRLGGAQATNLVGAFLSGLAVGVVAAPCVGPFVVALLGVIGQKADLGFGVSSMFTLSLGLGFPYIFLASFSNMLQRLPRSGDWMVWVKHAFGIALVGIGLYYLSVGFAADAAAWVLPLTLAAGGLWLGFLDRSAGAKGAFRTFALAFGGIALFAGVFLGGQLYQKLLRTLTFKPYSATALQASVAAGRPVMMDFSADWCLPCHEMELQTFTDPRVVAKAKDFDRYKIDLTKYDSPESAALRKRYGINGVPIVVFIGKDGNEIAEARVDGFLPPDRFLQQLELGAAAR